MNVCWINEHWLDPWVDIGCMHGCWMYACCLGNYFTIFINATVTTTSTTTTSARATSTTTTTATTTSTIIPPKWVYGCVCEWVCLNECVFTFGFVCVCVCVWVFVCVRYCCWIRVCENDVCVCKNECVSGEWVFLCPYDKRTTYGLFLCSSVRWQSPDSSPIRVMHHARLILSPSPFCTLRSMCCPKVTSDIPLYRCGEESDVK